LNAERPWWASDPAAEFDPELDPVEAHRSARRGWSTAGGDGPVGSATGADARGHDPGVCGVCPICVGLRLLGEVRPELLTHLSEAGRHLAAAARALLEPPPGRDGPHRPGSPSDPE
jgi:hypothetical protein